MSVPVSRRVFLHAANAAALVGLAAPAAAQTTSPAPSVQSQRGRAMHKLVVLYPPQPDPDAFKAYYAKTHIPLARKIPGLVALRYSFDVAGVGPGAPPYFCVFEAEFSDGASFGAAMSSPEGQAVASDVPNFAQIGPTLIHYSVDGGT